MENTPQDQNSNVTPLQPAEDSPVSRAHEIFARDLSSSQVHQVKDALAQQDVDTSTDPANYGGNISEEKLQELTALVTASGVSSQTIAPDSRRSRASVEGQVVELPSVGPEKTPPDLPPAA